MPEHMPELEPIEICEHCGETFELCCCPFDDVDDDSDDAWDGDDVD
jgi:hypothetical protein